MTATAPTAALAGERRDDAAEETRRLYETYGQRVFTFCMSNLRNREEAQDATQTTFIYALRSLRRGVRPEFEQAWLLKIAFNVCRSTRRTLGRRFASTTYGVEEIVDAVSATGEDADERLAHLQEALHSLPENQRRAILLREWQGLRYAEIADELGLTVAAVETLLFRARRNLVERLNAPQRPRLVRRAVDLGSILAALRSFLCPGAAKIAGVAGAASVAVVPLVAPVASTTTHDARLPDGRPAVWGAWHPAGHEDRAAAGAARTAATVVSPARPSLRRTARSGTVRPSTEVPAAPVPPAGAASTAPAPPSTAPPAPAAPGPPSVPEVQVAAPPPVTVPEPTGVVSDPTAVVPRPPPLPAPDTQVSLPPIPE